MFYIVIVLFCFLLFFGRDDLGLTGIGVSLLVFVGTLGLCVWLGFSLGYFMAFAAVFDIALVMKIFGGDLNIG
jgi:hypothetical protein